MCWMAATMGFTNISNHLRRTFNFVLIICVITRQEMDPERQKRKEDISKAMSFIK